MKGVIFLVDALKMESYTIGWCKEYVPLITDDSISTAG